MSSGGDGFEGNSVTDAYTLDWWLVLKRSLSDHGRDRASITIPYWLADRANLTEHIAVEQKDGGECRISQAAASEGFKPNRIGRDGAGLQIGFPGNIVNWLPVERGSALVIEFDTRNMKDGAIVRGEKEFDESRWRTVSKLDLKQKLSE